VAEDVAVVSAYRLLLSVYRTMTAWMPVTLERRLWLGYWMLDAGCSMLDARCSMLDARCSMLDARCSMLDARCSMSPMRRPVLCGL
jgi:hypothetical protein